MEENIYETRASLHAIADYNLVFGEEKGIDDFYALIKGIPPLTLIIFLSNINRKLYLKDKGASQLTRQINILNAFYPSLSNTIVERAIAAELHPESIIIFYRISTLLFLDLILDLYDHSAPTDISQEQMENFIKAYLIINSILIKKIDIDLAELETAKSNNETDDYLIAKFMFERDFESNIDYSNQVSRCVNLFQYLDHSPKYAPFMPEYYNILHVSGAKDLANQLLILAQEFITNDQRTSIEIDHSLGENFITHLSFIKYKSAGNFDTKFSALREKMFLKCPNGKYLLLDIGFLIDQFYKAQVFLFNKFVTGKGQTNFLTDKAYEFFERQYFHLLMERIFPGYLSFNGDKSTLLDGNELCDYYLRKGNTILLFECKDILIRHEIKTSGDVKNLFKELDKKLIENENGSPKGLKQLFNALVTLEKESIPFDPLEISQKYEVYPILSYSDNSLGFDGIANHYKKIFQSYLSTTVFTRLIVHNIVFININLFEFLENFFTNGCLSIETIINNYEIHITKDGFSESPFEIFAKQFQKNNCDFSLGAPLLFQESVRQILQPQ